MTTPPFRKVLIANRGEIAVRILRSCQELGVAALALYEEQDRGSLHVRLADECARLEAPGGFRNAAAVLEIARQRGADAIHPGYGFLAEEPEFVRQCSEAGLAFIGPPAQVIAAARDKIGAMQRARAAGLPTVEHSERSFGADEYTDLQQAASRLGYPLIVKSLRGGRGRGERLVRSPAGLEQAVRRAQGEAQAFYGDRGVYLERAVVAGHQVGVQILGDRSGSRIHLGERQGSLIVGNQKLIQESPAPALSPVQSRAICQAALQIAALFQLESAATVEFLVDGDGRYYFTEIKPRIQGDHPITELTARLDLVSEQICLVAGQPLSLRQGDVRLDGWAMLCRLSAEDPAAGLLPAPGRLRRVRFPSGPELRVDTYVYDGCRVPGEYDPLIAKLAAWGPDRQACLERLRRALQETRLSGLPNNLPLLLHIVHHPEFEAGLYDSGFMQRSGLLRAGGFNSRVQTAPEAEALRRDLAAAAAVYYVRRMQAFEPVTPERLNSGWHRSSRRLPE